MLTPFYFFVKRYYHTRNKIEGEVLLFTPTSRTPLRDVERTHKGANASLPCRQAYFNAGKPGYWNEVRVNSNGEVSHTIKKLPLKISQHGKWLCWRSFVTVFSYMLFHPIIPDTLCSFRRRQTDLPLSAVPDGI